MKIINKETIANNEPFILKWVNNPYDPVNGAKSENLIYKPGIKQQTEADRLLDLIQNSTSTLNMSRFIKMDAIEHDVNYMRVDGKLVSMKALSDLQTGEKAGAPLQKGYDNLQETTPQFFRSKLVAEPFTIKSLTSKLFLETNIEKQGFLPHLEARLAEQAGVSAENIGMYGVRTPSKGSDGVYHIDGVFKQLDDISKQPNKGKKDPIGYMKNEIDASKGGLVKELKNMITQFTKQRGNRANAKIFVSSEMEGLLMQEADARTTDKGDNLYFDNGELRLWGVPIIRADFLDDYPAKVGDVKYQEQILMADPDSIVFGFLSDITSENQYLLQYKSYLSTVDVYFDVLILYNKDVLAAKVKNMPSDEGDDGKKNNS